MQPYSNTGECSSLDDLIVSCSERVRILAWSFARSLSCVDVDDMYSVGMLEVCEAAVRAVDLEEPIGYLYQAARYAMIKEYQRLHRWSTVSLDVPLSNNSDECFVDLLPASSSVSVSSDSKRVCALHGALQRLPVRQRAVVKRRAGLPGYGTHTPEEAVRALHLSSTDVVHMLDYHGRHKLARDARLCKVMGVEVQA